MKLVCVKDQNERVVGFHYLGPNAGEVTQGFALAMKLGATKAHFDQTSELASSSVPVLIRTFFQRSHLFCC